MNQDVIISIIGQETLGSDQAVELVTPGSFVRDGDKYYLSYQETEVSGFDDETTTTLKIEGDTVAMTRVGQINTHMVFRRGEKHMGHYETPYGSFTVGILSDDVDIKLGDNGGEIRIKYLLEIDNSTKAMHDLHLNIRKVN